MLKGRIGNVWYSPEKELGSVAFACSKSSLILGLARMTIVAVWDFIIPIRSILLKNKWSENPVSLIPPSYHLDLNRQIVQSHQRKIVKNSKLFVKFGAFKPSLPTKNLTAVGSCRLFFVFWRIQINVFLMQLPCLGKVIVRPNMVNLKICLCFYLVVSNIVYVHPYLGKILNLTNIF